MIRFIHTADIHLDSPLTGLAAYEGAPTDLLRTATRAAFSQLIDAALRHNVDDAYPVGSAAYDIL